MKITLFGATGDLGQQCLQQCLDAGHDITVLVRNPAKLPEALHSKITIIQGDALNSHHVNSALPPSTEAILFAIGVDEKTSPPDLFSSAREFNFPFGYTSTSVDDLPPEDTIVTFPLHRIGRVREVVDSDTVCPKVLADFLDDFRPPASCQDHCRRCHNPTKSF